MSNPTFDIGPMLVWVAGLSLLLSFGTTLWNLINSGARQSARQIAQMTVRIDDMDREVQRLTDKTDNMPNTDMMHRLELSMARMEGHIDRLDERLKPVAAIAERMQEVLIEQGRK